MRQRRRLAARWTLASLVLWCGWSALRPHAHPFADLSRGGYTDHFSHLSIARLFPRLGLDVWRRTVRENVQGMPPVSADALPEDLRPFLADKGLVFAAPPGWPQDKPFVCSWGDIRRYYPPGDELLFAPAALAYQLLPLSFSLANRVVMLLLLLYAHLSVYVVLDEALRRGRPLGWLGWLVLGFVYLALIHFTLEGFYDAAMVGPLVLSARWGREGRPLAALVAYGAAAFIHFRAYFLAPFALAALVGLWRARAWRSFGAADRAALGAAAVLGGASLATFAMCWVGLSAMWTRNVVHVALGAPITHPAAVAAFLAVAVGAAALLLRAGAPWDAVMVAWLTVMFIRLPAAYAWYMLVLVPWLVAGLSTRAAPRWLFRAAQLGYCAFVVTVVCRDRLAPLWLKQLF